MEESETPPTEEVQTQPVTPAETPKNNKKYVLPGVVLLALLLAFAGWWFLMRDDPADNSQSAQTETSDEIVVEESTELVDTTDYIELDDLGVKIDPGELTDLTVFWRAFDGGGGYHVYFSTKTLEDQEKQLTGATDEDELLCGAESGAIGATSLYEANTVYQEDDSGKPAKDVLPQIAGTPYYGGVVNQPQASCSEDASLMQLQTELIGKIDGIKVLAL